MITAFEESSDGRKISIFGLSRVNIEWLLNEQPIHINEKTHKVCPAGMEFLILFRETEQNILQTIIDPRFNHDK